MLYFRLPVELTPGKLTWLVVTSVEKGGLRIATVILMMYSKKLDLFPETLSFMCVVFQASSRAHSRKAHLVGGDLSRAGWPENSNSDSHDV